MPPESRAAEWLEGIGALERATARWESSEGSPDRPVRERLAALSSRLQRLLNRPGRVAERSSSSQRRELVGDSQALRAILSLVERIAPRDSNVLLTGESGTGKELVARAIHMASGRRGAGFVTVDCGTVSDTLLDSELFGHRKGSFTGALQDRIGLLEEASGGTLFLDELVNSSPAFQTRLLRVLQEGEIRRVGENHERPVNLRVIAATSADLTELVRQNRFREDLYYRLNVVEMKLPPLRRRREDIPALVEHFVDHTTIRYGLAPRRFTQAALEVLLRYPWPGNVRELQNVVERSVLLAPGDAIAPDALPGPLLDALLRPGPADGEEETHKSGEQRLIEQSLLQSNGDKSRAARIIGWHRTKLYRRLRLYRIPYDFGRDRAVAPSPDLAHGVPEPVEDRGDGSG